MKGLRVSRMASTPIGPTTSRRVAATRGVNNPDGPPILNEIVTRPVTDWNGDGVIDSHDQWIEINFGAMPVLKSWVLSFSTSGGVKTCRLDRVATVSFVRLVIVQDPGSCGPLVTTMAENTTVLLRNVATSPIADQITVTGSTSTPSNQGFAQGTGRGRDVQAYPSDQGWEQPLEVAHGSTIRSDISSCGDAGERGIRGRRRDCFGRLLGIHNCVTARSRCSRAGEPFPRQGRHPPLRHRPEGRARAADRPERHRDHRQHVPAAPQTPGQPAAVRARCGRPRDAARPELPAPIELTAKPNYAVQHSAADRRRHAHAREHPPRSAAARCCCAARRRASSSTSSNSCWSRRSPRAPLTAAEIREKGHRLRQVELPGLQLHRRVRDRRQEGPINFPVVLPTLQGADDVRVERVGAAGHRLAARRCRACRRSFPTR